MICRPSDRQLDLFAATGPPSADPAPSRDQRAHLAPGDLDDEALIAAIPEARVADCFALAAEAGRRRLLSAIPALEALCRRFKGFGLHHTVPEQAAALAGLAAVGGRDAASAVGQIIIDGVVQGPGLSNAISVAAKLRAILPTETIVLLLRHAEPAIRADACRCAGPQPPVLSLLVDLLGDLQAAVATAAACALGQMGRLDARPRLLRLLREDPTAAVIAAIAGVANDDCIVQLGRIARTRPDLAEAAINALEDIDDPRAAAILTSIQSVSRQQG
jgi:hypothetical protein